MPQHTREYLSNPDFPLSAPPSPSDSLLSTPQRGGFYMVGAIVLQLATGFARVRALEAKSNNFSLFHRVGARRLVHSRSLSGDRGWPVGARMRTRDVPPPPAAVAGARKNDLHGRVLLLHRAFAPMPGYFLCTIIYHAVLLLAPRPRRTSTSTSTPAGSRTSRGWSSATAGSSSWPAPRTSYFPRSTSASR